VIFVFFSCNRNRININQQKPLEDNFIDSNIVNLEYYYPFYILKLKSYLLSSPNESIVKSSITLNFGDIVFPVTPIQITNNKVLCKTINNNIGWISLYDGISLDINNDKNLFYFSDKEEFYFMSKYKKNSVTDSDKIILIKNIVPALLKTDSTQGFFYPIDYNLAFELSQYAVDISKDQDTFFYSWAMTYNWRVNELLVSLNLLADSCHKLKMYDKAIEIHETILRRHFWKRSDNTQIAGLNSLIKLEKVYIEILKNTDKKSKEYNFYKKKVIEIAQKMDDTTNYFYLTDKEWDKSVAEWYIDIIFKNLDDSSFFELTNDIYDNVNSIGFKEFITVYQAIRHYNNKNTEEAFRLINSIKPKEEMLINLNIYEYLSQIQLIPNFLVKNKNK